MIEEQFVSFETAKMLKEAGFEEMVNSCFMYDDKADEYEYEFVNGYAIVKKALRDNYNDYENTISRPTQALAVRWLREVHKIHVYAIQTNLPYTEPQTTKWEWGYVIDNIDDPNSNVATCEMYFASYEAAFEAGIAKCLELIKK